jgi:hypothetical protein
MLDLMSLIKQLQSAAAHKYIPVTFNTNVICTFLKWIPDYRFRYRFVMRQPSYVLAEALLEMDPQLATQTLIMMQEKKRKEVISKLKSEDQDKMLANLICWQKFSFLDNLYPPTLVVTASRGLPRHLSSPSLRNCYLCGKNYQRWSSVNIASCNKHSYCDTCKGGSACEMCAPDMTNDALR